MEKPLKELPWNQQNTCHHNNDKETKSYLQELKTCLQTCACDLYNLYGDQASHLNNFRYNKKENLLHILKRKKLKGSPVHPHIPTSALTAILIPTG